MDCKPCPCTLRFALVILCMLAGADAADAQTAFYRAPPSAVAGAPGTLVRQEVIDGAPLGATAYRVLYRSTGVDDKPILVSGVVIVPPGDPPPGGRPIVAWAHPTSGIVPRCAPSLAIFLFQQIQGLRSFVRDGYVGRRNRLSRTGDGGTASLPGRHQRGPRGDRTPCGSRLSCRAPAAARSSWSGAIRRAAMPLCSPALSRKPTRRNWSCLGVAAAAPATDLVTLMNEDIDSVGGKNITAMTLWSWQRVFDANMDKVVDRRAMPAIDQLARECIEGPFDISGPPAHRAAAGTVFPDHQASVRRRTLAYACWQKIRPAPCPPRFRFFWRKGPTTSSFEPKVTQDYAAALCGAGSKVRILLMPNIGHGRAAQASTEAVLDWTSARFAGKAIPNDCSP